MTKFLTSGIIFSTAVNAEVVAKPLILGILPSISLTLAFQSVFLTSPLAWGSFLSAPLISFSKSDLSVVHLVFKTIPLVSILLTFELIYHTLFLTTSLFTTLLILLK